MVIPGEQKTATRPSSSKGARENIEKVDSKMAVRASPAAAALLETKIPVAQAFRRTCYKCGNLGHHAEECVSTERLCYNCKQSGHESSKCPNDRSSESKQCYYCKVVGHIQSECPSYKSAKEDRTNNHMKNNINNPSHTTDNYTIQNLRNSEGYTYAVPAFQVPSEYISDPTAAAFHQQQLQHQYRLQNQHYLPTQSSSAVPVPVQLQYVRVVDYNPTIDQARIPCQHRYGNQFAGGYLPNQTHIPYNAHYFQGYLQSYPQTSPQNFHLYQHQHQIHQRKQYNNLIQLRSHNTSSEPLAVKYQPHCYTCGELGHESKNCIHSNKKH